MFRPFNYLDIGKPQRRSGRKRLDIPERNQHGAEVPKSRQIDRYGTSQRLQIHLNLLRMSLPSSPEVGSRYRNAQDDRIAIVGELFRLLSDARQDSVSQDHTAIRFFFGLLISHDPAHRQPSPFSRTYHRRHLDKESF
jgi:hypothetical protein